MPRPDRLIVVTGTGTEVGKTYVTSHLLARARRGGLTTAARKPAQSYTPGTGPTDADVLAEVTGEQPEAVCPRHRWYPTPMAPPMAADVLGRPPFTVADLTRELVWPSAVDIGAVELAGGVCSPMAHDGDGAAFIAAVDPDGVVLVADAGLGTIHAVRAASAALATATGRPLLVYLNRFDPNDDLHRRNRRWLTEQCGYTVAAAPEEVIE